MIYAVKPTSRFQKDLKLMQRRGYNMALMATTITLLANGMPLPENYKDHSLSGNFSGYRKCHITPDWLLVYEIDQDAVILYLTRTGSHSALF